MKKKKEDNYSGDERREFDRIPFSVHVFCQPCGKDRKKLLNGGFPQYSYSSDISTDGLQFQSQFKPNLEEYIKIQLTIPEKKEKKVIKALGQVIWSTYDEYEETYAAGIKFVQIQDELKDRLKKFINSVKIK